MWNISVVRHIITLLQTIILVSRSAAIHSFTLEIFIKGLPCTIIGISQKPGKQGPCTHGTYILGNRYQKLLKKPKKLLKNNCVAIKRARTLSRSHIKEYTNQFQLLHKYGPSQKKNKTRHWCFRQI